MGMRPIEAPLAATSVPGPAGRGQPPGTVLLTFPAHRSFLATIRTAVGAMVREVGGADRDLQLATDEAAAVLIDDARPWTVVHLSIAHDDTDIYVRVVTQRAQPGRGLVIHELTTLLLDSVVESYEIFEEDRQAYAILQTAQDGVGRSS